MWQPLVLTSIGIAQRQLAIAESENPLGKRLRFGFAKIGSGVPTDISDIANMSDIVSSVADAVIKRSFGQDENQVIVVQVTNKGVVAKEFIREIGIFTRLANENDPPDTDLTGYSLYGYTYTLDEPLTLNPQSSETGFEMFDITVTNTLGNAASVSLNYDNTTVYATHYDLEQGLAKKVDGQYFILDSFVKLGIDPKTSDIETICKAIYNFQDTSGEFKGYVPFDVDVGLVGDDKTYPKVDGNITVNKVDIPNQEAVIFECDFESTYGGTHPADDPVRFAMWSAIATYIPSMDVFTFIPWQRNVNSRELDRVLESKANLDSPELTGNATLDGYEIAAKKSPMQFGIPLRSGIIPKDGQCRYFKDNNNIVHILFDIIKEDGSDLAPSFVGDIAEGFRPSSLVMGSATSLDYQDQIFAGVCYVTTAGEVYVTFSNAQIKRATGLLVFVSV